MKKLNLLLTLSIGLTFLFTACGKDEPKYRDEEFDIELDGLAYNIISLENYEAELVAKTYPSNYTGDIVVPEYITISGRPFKVITVGYECFYESSITSISLPNSIQTINDMAFLKCKNLKNITLPSSLVTISNGAFYDSGLLSITVPASVKTISSLNFLNCPNIKSIVIEDGTDPINIQESFWNNYYWDDSKPHANELQTVYIGRNIEEAYSNTFDYYESEALKSVKIGEFVTKFSGEFNKALDFYLYPAIPPATNCFGSNEFFINSNLFVPEESMSMYEETTFWGQFWNINKL